MSKVIGASRNRLYIYVHNMPLAGHIAFGVIDRGTNILQVRPTTICPYNCISVVLMQAPTLAIDKRSLLLIGGT
jgi:uncharacterized Fe-S cluster-containing radical SAM superfamily enzyme